MQAVEVAKQIEVKIQLLEKGRGMLLPLALERANKLAEYDKTLAIIILKLRNGQEMTFEGQPVKELPVTLTEKVAKGICWQEKLASETADTEYVLAVKKLQTVESELQGYQSIFRHLSEM